MSVQNQTLRRLGLVTSTQIDADWNAVYRTELPRVYNYFRYRFGNNALAEDLTSATFEKAWRARDKYRHDLAAFSTWLFTIARNQATDYLRKRGATVSFETLHEIPAPNSLAEEYEHRAELEQLGALLAQLPERDRELIALKYGAQLNNREIAKQLGISESNVGTTLHRIVNRLKQRWSDHASA